MTDRSITECYFSNPTEISLFASSNSYGIIKIEDNANGEEKNISKIEQKNNDSNCEVVRPTKNFEMSKFKSNCGKRMEYNKVSSHNNSKPVFPVEYSNDDSFSQTENICNEKQPFGEDDSISFNDYSLIKDSHHSDRPTFSKNNASNFLENNVAFNEPPNLKMRLSAGEYSSLYDSKSYSEIDEVEKHLNYCINTLDSQLLLEDNIQCHGEKKDKGKDYPFDGYAAEVTGRHSTPYKENKPIKALGLNQSNSKSLQDFSKVYVNDVNEAKPSQRKDDFSYDYSKIGTGSFMRIKNPLTIRPTQKNLNSNSSGSLEIAKNECNSWPENKNALNKAKSISLHSLQGIKKSDYSHIQSKVKLYIQNLKQKRKGKERETISLPSTPLRHSDNFENCSTIHLDENLFDTLASKKREDELPENLRILKSKLINSSENLNKKFGTELFEALFEQVKNERRQRIQQDVTLHKLQLDYNNLLAKYAQAENIIDKLRIFSGSSEIPMRIKNDSINCVGRVNEPINKTYCEIRQRYPKHQLKKAFSTSNIFHVPIVHEDDFLEGSLVKYSSSPIVDPNVNITLQIKPEQSEINMNFSKNKSLSLDKVNTNSTSTTLPFSSFKGNDTNAGSLCEKKYEALSQKLCEFAMLEGNLALKPSERDIIWNYLKKLYNEFFEDSTSMSPSLFRKQMLQNIYDGIIHLSSKYNLPTTGLSMTGVKMPIGLTTFSTVNTDDFKDCQESIYDRPFQHVYQRRMSLPVESSSSQSKYDISILYEDHLKTLSVEKEVAQENPNDSFIDSCQDEGLVNNLCLFPSSTPASFQQAEERHLGHTNNNKNRFICEAAKPFFKQESKKSVGSTSLKNRIAQYKAKDNDSGCPPSDRSTRNSPTISFSQHQTFSRENSMENLICLSDRSYSLAMPVTPLKSSKYFNLVTSSKNYTNGNDISWQTGYDASSSSADDESFFMCNPIRNKLKKQTNNHQEDSSHNDKKLQGKSIKKYEDRYVYGNCSPSYDQDLTSPNSFMQHAKNCFSPIRQLEKKSSLLNSQIDGLKGKHWKQPYSKGSTVHTSRMQPIKPVSEKSSCPVSNNYDQVKDNFKLQRHAEIINKDCLSNSEDDIVMNCKRVISKGDKKLSSTKRKVVCNAGTNPKQNLYLETSTLSSLKDSSSLRKKSNLAKAKSLNFSDFKFDALTEKSKSISSITQPIIYIEHYNCCDNNHKTHCKQKMCESKDSHISDTSSSNTRSKLNKRVNFIGSLDEATSLAERIQKTSVTLLENIRGDSLLRK